MSMTFAGLKTFIGSKCNDPSEQRYSASDKAQALEDSQTHFNLTAKILKSTTTLTVVDGTRQYALSGITGTPIAFERVTHKNIPLKKRSKSYFDLYLGGIDWTSVTGTPTQYFVEESDPSNQYLTVFPVPGPEDAGANLVVEAIIAHTPMSADGDYPFMKSGVSNYILRPYDVFVAYHAAYLLLMGDPTQENIIKAQGQDGDSGYKGIAQDGLDQIVQTLNALEQEEPPSIKHWPGRGVVRKHL